MRPSTTCNEYANKMITEKQTQTHLTWEEFSFVIICWDVHISPWNGGMHLMRKKYNRNKMGRWINGQPYSMRCLKHSVFHTREINLIYRIWRLEVWSSGYQMELCWLLKCYCSESLTNWRLLQEKLQILAGSNICGTLIFTTLLGWFLFTV